MELLYAFTYYLHAKPKGSEYEHSPDVHNVLRATWSARRDLSPNVEQIERHSILTI